MLFVVVLFFFSSSSSSSYSSFLFIILLLLLLLLLCGVGGWRLCYDLHSFSSRRLLIHSCHSRRTRHSVYCKPTHRTCLGAR